MLNSIEYNWKVYAIPCLTKILATIALGLSLLVIALEVGLYFNFQEVNLFRWWTEYSHNNPEGSFFLANGLCLLPLGYMCTASYYGMFRVKINAIFALHDKQMTDPVSLAYSGLLLTRLAIAVSYNYLEISDVHGSAFFTVMGPMDNIEFLGENFNKWVFPSLMFLTIFLTVTDCCSRILNCVGLKQYAFDEEYTEETVLEGQRVIDNWKRENEVSLKNPKMVYEEIASVYTSQAQEKESLINTL